MYLPLNDLSIYPFFLSIYVSIDLSIFHPPISLSLSPPVRPYPSFRLSVYLGHYLHTYISVYLPIYVSIYLSVCLRGCLSVHVQKAR